jgi:GDP-mannose 6-dehydrogenase
VIELIERLIGTGYDLRIYDKNVSISRLVCANRDFILNRSPHISRLVVADIETALDHAQTVVVANNDPAFRRVPDSLCNGQVLVDLVRIGYQRTTNGTYEGIRW